MKGNTLIKLFLKKLNNFCNYRVQYQFEEEPFDAVPDLITFYVGSGKAISAASGDTFT
jgi:hypothetical protein